MSETEMNVRNLLSDLIDEIKNLNGSKLDAIQYAIKMLNEEREGYVSPVYNVIAVPFEKIRANSYNPNSVASPELKLLELSIAEDGYTMPVVCYYIPEEDIYEIVDGFHRYITLRDSKRINEREANMLPCVVIDKDIQNRMASTIRHNRARGVHSIDLMSNIVAELTGAGMSDAWILRHIGMDRDELLRLKQITGLAALFANEEFSESWEIKSNSNDDTEESGDI